MNKRILGTTTADVMKKFLTLAERMTRRNVLQQLPLKSFGTIRSGLYATDGYRAMHLKLDGEYYPPDFTFAIHPEFKKMIKGSNEINLFSDGTFSMEGISDSFNHKDYLRTTVEDAISQARRGTQVEIPTSTFKEMVKNSEFVNFAYKEFHISINGHPYETTTYSGGGEIDVQTKYLTDILNTKCVGKTINLYLTNERLLLESDNWSHLLLPCRRA